MYRTAVVTDAETATGFRLAGIEVREAKSPGETLEHIRALVTLDYGLIAVNEDLLRGIGDDLDRLMRDRDLPILVPFPAPQEKLERGEDYINRLVKEHIGFFVKLR